MTTTPAQQQRLGELADDLVRRGFGEGDEFYVMTGTPRGVDLGSELWMLAVEDDAFQVEMHDLGRTDVVLRTADLEEAIRAFVPRVVSLVRERRSLRAVDVTGLPGDVER